VKKSGAAESILSASHAGAAAPRFNVTPPDPVNDPAAPTGAAPTAKDITPAAAPAGIPREPLPGEAGATVPFTARSLGWSLAAPGLAGFGWWLALAYWRARATDPLRPRREARVRLAAHLAALTRARPGEHRAPRAPDDLGSRPDRQLAYKETLASIEEFLASSDEMNRQVYMLMDVVGMEKEEVAEKLDLTIPALKARLHRIRYALREHLGSAA
jgi:hypothetical protein